MAILEHYDNIYHNENIGAEYGAEYGTEHGEERVIDRKDKKRKAIDAEPIKEGFTSAIDKKANVADSVWNLEKSIQAQIFDMSGPLGKFCLFTVANLIIVWVVWKIGSHVMWFNSIPRALLESIYPPSQDYLDAILKENSKPGGACTGNIEESGGKKTISALYSPDQVNAVEERNKCCKIGGASAPGFPYPPGTKIPLDCWPLNTSENTAKNYNKLNELYKILKPPNYKECILYDEWYADNEVEADKQLTRIADAKAKLTQAKSGGAGNTPMGVTSSTDHASIASVLTNLLRSQGPHPLGADYQSTMKMKMESLAKAWGGLNKGNEDEVLKLAEEMTTFQNKSSQKQINAQNKLTNENDRKEYQAHVDKLDDVLKKIAAAAVPVKSGGAGPVPAAAGSDPSSENLFTRIKKAVVGQTPAVSVAKELNPISSAEKARVDVAVAAANTTLETNRIDADIAEVEKIVPDVEEVGAGVIETTIESLGKIIIDAWRSFWRFVLGCTYDNLAQSFFFGRQTPTSFFTKITVGMRSSISSVVYLCLSAGSSNIIISAILGIVGVAIGCGIVNVLWFSPLPLLWMIYSFNLGRGGSFLVLCSLLFSGGLIGVLLGFPFVVYILQLVVGQLWVGGLFGNKGEKWKGRLRNCPSTLTSLRRLFIILTFVNAFINLRIEVVIGMVICFIGIEYYYHSSTGKKLAALALAAAASAEAAVTPAAPIVVKAAAKK